MGAQVGQIFQNLLAKNGVKFKMGASIEKATPSCKKTFTTALISFID